MCGRFTNRYSWSELVGLYRITEPWIAPVSNMEPRFNIAPTQRSIVVRLDADGRRQPVAMRWGLVPFWSKDDKAGASMINAKAETVAEKPAFRAAFKARPCLVVTDGFYEWQTLGPKQKQPHYIRLKHGGPFAFAGLWESWRDRTAPTDATPLESFTILTTEPNSLMATLHTRMPVLLAPEEWDQWLGSAADRAPLLRAFPADRKECWPVAKNVGSVRNEGPGLIEPLRRLAL